MIGAALVDVAETDAEGFTGGAACKASGEREALDAKGEEELAIVSIGERVFGVGERAFETVPLVDDLNVDAVKLA